MAQVIPVRILVIDDDASVCRKVARWLGGDLFDVITFTDPAEGLAHARRAPCQVGLVDLRLAEADGVEVVAELRRVAPRMRLIAMGAFPDAQQVIAVMRAGARDMLQKPVQEQALREALQRQLAEAGLSMRSEGEFNRRVGTRIRVLRTQTKRTLADVASECGITAAQLSQIELGKSATSVWSLARISSALGTPLNEVLGGL